MRCSPVIDLGLRIGEYPLVVRGTVRFEGFGMLAFPVVRGGFFYALVPGRLALADRNHPAVRYIICFILVYFLILTVAIGLQLTFGRPDLIFSLLVQRFPEYQRRAIALL